MSAKKFCGSLFLTVVLLSSAYADWKSDANARIEQFRKRNAEITVLGSSGMPVSDVNVQIVQVKKQYKFGAALNYNSTSGNAIYRNFVLSHFNYAVCEDATKWGSNEGTRGTINYDQADTIYNFCHTNGIPMRGHCIFWEQNNGNMPNWLKTITDYKPWPQASDFYTACQNRINSVVPHFQNKFENWDVDNEQLNTGSDYQFFDRLEVGGPGSSDVNSRVWMYQRAHELDPNCKLFVNEYSGNSFGGFDGTTYVNYINTLRSKGAPIHAIGIQGHINSPFNDTQAQQYWTSVLKPLGTAGLPIWATEFDSDTTSDSQRATDVENYLRIVYSDPNTQAIILWGFMVGTTWRANTQWGIVSSSGTLNAAGQTYEALMSEWTTQDADITDTNGEADFRGFHGTYQVTLSKVGEPNTEIHTIELEQGAGTAEFELNTGFYSGPPETNAPTPNPMTWASVPAATGPYSITMTATTASDNSPPVKYYFECTNHGEANSAWQTSPTYTVSSLNPSTLYTFRVKARDNSPAQNQTDWSSEESATTDPPDTTPPGPSPTTWATAPTATGAGTITMTASTANDITSPPVQYYFECTNHGEASSAWQSSPTYIAAGLIPSTQYSFRAKARDSAIPARNETDWSDISSAVTPAPPTDVNIIGSWLIGTTHTKENGYNRALIFIAQEESISGNPVLTSVTYGGQTMTKIMDACAVSSGYGNYVAAFILKEPNIAAASDSTFTPAWSAATSSVSYASVFLESVDQTNSIGASAKNSTTSSSPNPIMTSAIAANDNDMVILSVVCGNVGTYNLNNSFIKGSDQTAGGSNGHTGATGHKSATGAAETPSATYNTGPNRQAIIGFVLKAAASCDTVLAAGHRMTADLTGDCYVDYQDLKIMADYWLNTECGTSGNCSGADFTPADGIVNFYDFSDFAVQWMQCNDPANVNCASN